MADDTVPSSTFVVDNPGEGVGSQYDQNKYNICQKSGFKVKPGELSTEYNGKLVRPESFDKRHPQLRVRDKAELLTGSIRPEPADTFIDSISDPSTL